MEADAIHEFLRTRIRELRLERNLTQRAAAELASLPQSSYCSIETGAYRVTVENLYRIAAALNVEISMLWPSTWDQSLSSRSGDSLNSFEQLNFFRLREIVLHANSSAALLWFESSHHARVLAWINVDERTQLRLARLRRLQASSQGWTVLERHQDCYSICLCLRDSRMTEFVHDLVDCYLQMWLTSEIALAKLGVHLPRNSSLGISAASVLA